MYHHFLFIDRLAEALNKQLQDSVLTACFSQNRDELILTFDNNFIIKADLRPEVSLLSFQDEFARARKNSVNLFNSLIGLKVEKIASVKWDRSFCIYFANGTQLIFKLYGRRSNIIAFNGDKQSELFRTELGQDQQLSSEAFKSEQTWIQSVPDADRLAQMIGGELMKDLSERDLLPISEASIQYLKSLPIHIQIAPELLFSLLVTNSNKSEVFTDPILASNRYYYLFTNTTLFKKEKDKRLHVIDQKIRQATTI